MRSDHDPGSQVTAVCRVTTRSADETRSLAAHVATVAAAGDRIALLGDLGAGKTQFAKGFAVGLGVRAVVNSPSFTLMAEYEGRLPLFHVDLFRLAGAADAIAGGVVDERQTGGVSLVEWAERLGGAVAGFDLEVAFDGAADEPRDLTLTARTASGARYVALARSRSAPASASMGARTAVGGPAPGTERARGAETAPGRETAPRREAAPGGGAAQ